MRISMIKVASRNIHANSSTASSRPFHTLGMRCAAYCTNTLGAQFPCAQVKNKKISPKRKFLGRISRGHSGVICADIPAQNFGQGVEKQAIGRGYPWTMTRRRGRPQPWGISKTLVRKTLGRIFASHQVN